MILFVHNQYENVTLDSDFVQVSPEKETTITIEKTVVTKLSGHFSDCVENADPLRDTDLNNKYIMQTQMLFTNYSKNNCLKLCYQDYLIQTYRCYDRYLPYLNSSSSSSSSPCGKQIDSTDNLKYYDRKKYESENASLNCNRLCREECETVLYDESVSTAQFPADDYKKILELKDTYKANVYSVNVFYKDNFYTAINDKPQLETEIFISNIGKICILIF